MRWIQLCQNGSFQNGFEKKDGITKNYLKIVYQHIIYVTIINGIKYNIDRINNKKDKKC